MFYSGIHASDWMRGVVNTCPIYFVAGILLPFLYDSWRFTVHHFLVGPGLAMPLTRNPDDAAAIWCLPSIGILLLVVKTPMRRVMPVKSWWLWRKKIV